MAAIERSDRVRALAAIVRSALEGARTELPMDEALARFGAVRHRVGPLLHQAVECGGVGADAGTIDLLAKAWITNRNSVTRQKLLIGTVTSSLRKAGIGFTVFKGLSLSRQLYTAPEWRHCGDLDVLVDPSEAARAARTLRQAGLKIIDPIGRLPGWSWPFLLGMTRDFGLFDAISRQKLELHSRLFFSPAINARLLGAEPALRPRLPKETKDIPAPDLGAGTACYLLMHGAISGWARLKWLVDVHLLLGRLDRTALDRLPAVAETCRVASAVKAGLLLAQDVFDAEIPDPLNAWVAEPGDKAGVRRRLARYAAWISEASVAAPNPLQDRRSYLTSVLLLNDSVSAMLTLLPFSGFSSGLRFVASLAPKRGE